MRCYRVVKDQLRSGNRPKRKRPGLKEHLELPHGIPSHDTIGRLLVALKPAAFQACFTAWIAALVKARESRLREETDDPSLVKHRHLAIDGKTLRGSHDHRKGLGALHLVSVWAVDCGVSLGQLATAEKSNEITAIPELLEQVQLKNSIVTIDAAGCQKEIAAKIVDGRGDYCLALKGNQGNLHAAVSGWIEEQMETDFADCRVETLERREKKHGREDHYTYYQFERGRNYRDDRSGKSSRPWAWRSAAANAASRRPTTCAITSILFRST